MKNRRPEIVGDEIQKIISTIISTKLKDPRVPLLTSVTSVKMSRDLSHATVFISVYGDEKTQKEAMEHGRKQAMEASAEFVVHGKDGKIRLSTSYGNDPRNSVSKKTNTSNKTSKKNSHSS
jgi:ribosome-binding factor A